MVSNVKLYLPFDDGMYHVRSEYRAGAIRVHLVQVTDGAHHYAVSSGSGEFVCSCPDKFQCEHIRGLVLVGVLPGRN